jgi:hypothetical protein
MSRVLMFMICCLSCSCVASPYLEEARQRDEKEFQRTREELNDFRTHVHERVVSSGLLMDDSVDPQVPMLVQPIDNMMDHDMLSVVEARNAVEANNIDSIMNQHEWLTFFFLECRDRSNGAVMIEPTDRSAFAHPDTIMQSAWCVWYVRDGKRRELVFDPSTREVGQSVRWEKIPQDN